VQAFPKNYVWEKIVGTRYAYEHQFTNKQRDDRMARPLPPMPVAAARGDIDALVALLAEGIDINAPTRTQSRTPLMEACKGNSDKAVDFLIAKGCVRGASRGTALQASSLGAHGDGVMECFSAQLRAHWIGPESSVRQI